MCKNILLGVGIFSTGALLGLLGYGLFHRHFDPNASRQIRMMGVYEFINPLLECEVAGGTLDSRKENFHTELEIFVDTLKRDRQLTDASVYFRDLNNGPAFGVNETGEFFPASLLKVPVMMAYYRLSEIYPDILKKEVLFEAPRDFGVTPMIVPREHLTPGTPYTVEELIRRMIIYSDNQSLFLLVSHLPKGNIEELFDMLGVGEDVLTDAGGKLTVKEYAGFFRILFNSSYLSRENSEKALRLLSETDYNDVLPGRLPGGMKVSHKFGEAGTGETERQLHDCGVVYFPDHPYLVCIMTRGQRTEDLKKSISDISFFIYEKIDEQY